MTLVEGGKGDLDAIVALMRDAFDPRFGEAWTLGQALGIVAMPGVAITLARRRERLLGFALARTVLDDCELMLLAVERGVRRTGVGDALLAAVIAQGRRDGARQVHLEVRDGNPAEQLYCRQGFRLVGARPRYYHGCFGEVFDARTYRLDFSESPTAQN